MLKEKRRYARLPFRAEVARQLGTKRFKAESVNISEGGILLEGSGGAGVGEELSLEFMLPQAGSRLRVQSKVVRKEAPDRIALQFRNLDAQGHLAIQVHISGQVKS